MPPRRTKRPRLSKDVTKGLPPTAPTQLVVNGKCKFIEMPVELLLEIMSYFPAVPIPTSRRFNVPVLPPSVFERWDVLRALSQTCRLWRSIFFSILWERMEACAVRDTKKKAVAGTAPAGLGRVPDIDNFGRDDMPTGWYKDIARLLENVSKALSSNPQAAQHVRIVNVAITRCSIWTVLPAFVQCLKDLPNVHTLQILRAHTQMSDMLQTYFKGQSFPTIRTVIIPEHGHEVLRCCPQARKVYCNYGDGSKIITAISKCCKYVEVVEGVKADKNYMKRLAKACPNLRELKLDTGIELNTSETMTVLAGFKHLTRLEFQVSQNYADTYHKNPVITRIIKGGGDILRLSKAQGKKTLRLFYIAKRPQYDKDWSLDVPV